VIDWHLPVAALNMEPWASQLALDGLSGLIGGGVVDWHLPVAALNMEPWASQLALDGLYGLIGGGRASPSFSIPPFIIESGGKNSQAQIWIPSKAFNIWELSWH